MRYFESDRRNWALVAVLLLLGLLCTFVSANLAIRFAPTWSLLADMNSRLDPNTGLLTPGPDNVVQPIDPAILTQPIWIDFFLTPGASVPTRLPNSTGMPTERVVPTQVVNTIPPTASPTSTLAPIIPTQTIKPAATWTSTSKAPAGPMKTPLPAPTLTPSNVPPSQADLQITKNNGMIVYSAGSAVTYTIAVTNNGPGNAVGAVISDAFQLNLSDWSWACTSQSKGASGCDPAASNTSNFSDTIDLPAGSSIVYTVTASIRADASGSLVNTASIAPPAGMVDPAPGNNSATDSDDLLQPLPYGNIGSSYDGTIDVIGPGGSITLAFDTPLVVGGHPGWDLILYELQNGSGIAMDLLTLQISDGTNWYTVLNWGDNAPDTNTNMNIAVLGGEETDNRDFTTPPASDVLYNGTGIVIELDGVVLPGTYPYFRISSPASGSGGSDIDGGSEIDGVVIFP